MKTEIHHQKEGVLARWAHTCGHLSNPMWYADASFAENARETMESMDCWECRNRRALGLPGPLSGPGHVERVTPA